MGDQEFKAVASVTRLSKDSREAARLVFVEGLNQVEAGQQMNLSPQRMTQIVKTIRREQEKRRAGVSETIDLLGTSYAVAVKNARDKFGDDVVLGAPADAKRTVGQVVSRTDFHLVQHVGKDNVVIYELAKLDRAPAVGKNIVIEYSNGKGTVVDRSQNKDRGGISR